MALVTITELQRLAYDDSAEPVLAPEMDGTQIEQNIVPQVGVSTTCLNGFDATTRYILVNVDAACFLGFGPSAAAVADKHKIGAGETRYYGVKGGHKLAAMLAS